MPEDKLVDLSQTLELEYEDEIAEVNRQFSETGQEPDSPEGQGQGTTPPPNGAQKPPGKEG